MAVDFESALARVLVREIPGCRRLVSIERLSGGASQETYKLVIEDAYGERSLCLRRATGGVGTAEDDDLRESIGLPTEALLITTAREGGVPEPEVLVPELRVREEQVGAPQPQLFGLLELDVGLLEAGLQRPQPAEELAAPVSGYALLSEDV